MLAILRHRCALDDESQQNSKAGLRAGKEFLQSYYTTTRVLNKKNVSTLSFHQSYILHLHIHEASTYIRPTLESEGKISAYIGSLEIH